MKVKPILEVTRGAIVESVHHGAIAVADPSGKLRAAWGDPKLVTYLRSSAKPIQVLPFLESGAAESFGIEEAEIAVACASHSGTDEHVQKVRSIQSKVGVDESDLQCGVHPPFDVATAKRLEDRGEDPTPIRHNCSGKHSGMLGLAKFLELSTDDYLLPSHPVQQIILRTFSEMCGLEPDQVVIGIDGCSAPNFAISLQAAATGFARLADPSRLSEKRVDACRRVFHSMTSRPEMVAGSGRFDTELMLVTGERLIVKSGAEGYSAIGVAPGVMGEDLPALGVAIKIADGNLGHRAGPPVVLEVLCSLGVLAEDELERLARFKGRPLTNFRGIETGELRPQLNLKGLSSS